MLRSKPLEMPVIAPRFRALLGSYWVEILWAVFVACNYAAKWLWPTWGTVPFHFAWVGLTVAYGFRVWPRHAAILVLSTVVFVTAGAIAIDGILAPRRWAELGEIPLLAAMFMVMIWHDRRRVDALRQAEGHADELKSMLEQHERFIHDASHELRTPVTIARGHLELVMAGGLDYPELDIALDELSRIDGIIERLLLLATADRPDFVRLEQLDVEPFLEDVFMRWSEVAARHWRLGPLVSGTLLADPERLRTALDALLENALKYTDERDAIELRARRDSGHGIVIEVEDQGCGIPQEALTRIFQRFGRADPSRSRAVGGVGLGLAIVDAVARSHDGRCTVTSSEHGSVFGLHLPGLVTSGHDASSRSDAPSGSRVVPGYPPAPARF
jgi:signal transduction histidine kinase